MCVSGEESSRLREQQTSAMALSQEHAGHIGGTAQSSLWVEESEVKVNRGQSP